MSLDKQEEAILAELGAIRHLKKSIKKDIRSLDSYTSEERIKKFNEMYNFAIKRLQYRIQGEYDKDVHYYAFEMIMNLLGEKIWNVWNGLPPNNY